MSVNFIRLLELLSIEQQDDRYYLNVIITIDQEINLFWEVDTETAIQLKDACEFDGKFRYRLSLRAKSDSSNEDFQSFITKTYLDKSYRVHFNCSADYKKQIDLLKRCTTIEQLKNLSFLYEELPEPEVEEPIIEEVPSDLEEAPEDSERTQEMDNDEEIVVEEINQETETKEENASVETSDSDETKVEATVEETDKKIDSESEKDTTTEEVEQQEQESNVVHNKEETTVKHKNKSKKWLIISIISIVVIGLIIFFIFSSKTPSTDKSVEDTGKSSGSQIPSHSVEDLVTFGLPEDMVALTFNKGPTKYTPKIIEILDEYKVGGTFFFLDTQVGSFPKTVLYTYNSGFSIGCMTDSPLSTLSLAEQEKQLTNSIKAIEEITSESIHLYRPQDGLFNKDTQDVLEKQELKLVLWSLDPREVEARSSEEIIDYIQNNELSGSIVLLNESNAVVEALPEIIETLQKQNYRIVSLQ